MYAHVSLFYACNKVRFSHKEVHMNMPPILYQGYYSFFNYAPVICNQIPPRAGESGDIAGLNYCDFTFEVSR